jgi:hypothetical protein
MTIESVKNCSYSCVVYIKNKFIEFSQSKFTCTLWTIASKIKNFVFSYRPSPFERTPEQQQIFNQIKKRYEGLSRSAVIISQQSEQQATKLSQTRHSENDSKPIQQLRLLARQLAEAGIECAQEQVENPDLKKALKEITPVVPALCDIFSEIICNIIQKVSFENLIDRAVKIMDKETKVHIQAQKATEAEREGLIRAIKTCVQYEHEQAEDVDYRSIEAWQYNDAVQFLEQVTKVGKESLLKEVYAEAYDKALSSGKSEVEAKKQAHTARKEIRNTPSSKELCRAAYLRDFYLTTFVGNQGVTKNVGQIASALGVDSQGSQCLDVSNYINQLAKELSDQIISSFDQVINDAVLPNTFWLTYLKTSDALKMNSIKNKIVVHLVQPFITKSIQSLLQTLVSPQKLNKQIATNVLPSVKDQLIAQTCQFVITANWKELSPYFYALEIASKTDRKQISLDISDKVKKLIIEKEQVLNSITDDRFTKVVNDLLRQHFKNHKLIRQSLVEQKDTAQFNDFIHHLYKLVVICPALPKDEQANKRERTLTYLKTSILVMLPQSYRKRGQSLWKEAARRTEEDAFYTVVTPLIDKIEEELISKRDNTDQVVNEAFIKEVLIKFLKNGKLNAFPANPSKIYGEMIFNIGLEFGDLAPKTKTLTGLIPGVHQYVKNTINNSVISALAPFRASHKKIAQLVVDSLTSKFCKKDKKEIDKDKLKDFIFTKKTEALSENEEESDAEFYDCEESQPTMESEIATLASLSFGLVKQIPSTFLTSENLQEMLQWSLKKTLIGESPLVFANTLAKIQNGFFNHRLINLSRTAQLSRMVIHTLKEMGNNNVEKKSIPKSEPKQ